MKKIIQPILIATSNPHKIKRISEIIDPFFETWLNLLEWNNKLTINECGTSFIENSIIKSKEASKVFNGFAVGTDAGMHIPALEKKWNPLNTKRFAGELATDFERMDLLLKMMEDKKTDKERVMKWEEAIALSYKGKLLFSYNAYGPYGILQKGYNPQQYEKGIWLCTLWYFPEFQKNYFEFTQEDRRKLEVNWQAIKKEMRNYLAKNIDKIHKRVTT